MSEVVELRVKGTSHVLIGPFRIDFAVWRDRDSWPSRKGRQWWDRYRGTIYSSQVGRKWHGRFVQFGPLYLFVGRELAASDV